MLPLQVALQAPSARPDLAHPPSLAPAGLSCSPRLLGGRQPGLACPLLCDVRISPGLASLLLLCSDPSTNGFLIAGDRAEGGEESVGRLGHEGLGWEAETCPIRPFSSLFDSEERQTSISILKDTMKVQKMRLSPGLARWLPSELNQCLG